MEKISYQSWINFAKQNNVCVKFRAKINKKQKIFVFFNKSSAKCVF